MASPDSPSGSPVSHPLAEPAVKTFDKSMLDELFDSVDRASFPNYVAARQPWRDMSITFLADVDDPMGFDPQNKDCQVWKDVKLLRDKKDKCCGTGKLGGH